MWEATLRQQHACDELWVTAPRAHWPQVGTVRLNLKPTAIQTNGNTCSASCDCSSLNILRLLITSFVHVNTVCKATHLVRVLGSSALKFFSSQNPQRTAGGTSWILTFWQLQFSWHPFNGHADLQKQFKPLRCCRALSWSDSLRSENVPTSFRITKSSEHIFFLFK